jgi:hypothetical protein
MDKPCPQQDHRFGGKTGAVNNTVISVIGKFTLCFIFLGCLLSCGLESISFLDNIPEGSYSDTGTRIQLPSGSAPGYSEYFDYFIIYYRIYISDYQSSGIIDTATVRGYINSMLNNDFNSFERHTNTTTTTVYPITQDTFPNRGYYKLELEEGVINNVLGSGSLDSSLSISFSTNSGIDPILTINGNNYILQRANSGQGISFNPKPNRRFLNHLELYNSSDAINPSQSSTRLNADVYSSSLTTLSIPYTYVSMYIAAQGTSLDMPPQTIFSQPTFLGIFRLANAN